ncbi:leucine-rich repeat-containing protein 15-like [Leptopilina heterotoma]|uniref:leucine-rich repeat-containing protein 15-like n=1 Tax=Leptopilina heterotoma TaxID=63436 RepID=UPI001CA7FF93|nr:leucine-rich repeat-containing protein 15-like [Leptopilina heterotoma]
MAHLLQLFKLLTIFIMCYDFGNCFQKNPIDDQCLRGEPKLLIKETIIDEDKLFWSACEEQNSTSVSINLANLNIESLPNNFINSDYVSCLDLQNNNFGSTVHVSDFSKVPNLKYLNLGNTKIVLESFFSYSYYSVSQNIETLILNNLQAFQVQEYDYTVSFDGFNTVLKFWPRKLKKLSLRNINFTDNKNFESFDFSLTKITHLILSDNNIDVINSEFFNKFPTTLTHLFVDRCNLQSYSASINKTASLIYLSMDSNSFSSDGCLDFDSHPDLKYLSLSNCEISSILQNTFYSNSKLINLDLSNNRLNQLSDKLFLKTIALETLNLNNNKCSKLPKLKTLTNLKELYINGNNISRLVEDSFDNLNNLEVLTLSRNYIVYIEDNAMNNLSNLRILDLSKNNIFNFEYKSSFSLQCLSLTKNYLYSMTNIQLGNTTLKYLFIDQNPVDEITPMSINYLTKDTSIIFR